MDLGIIFECVYFLGYEFDVSHGSFGGSLCFLLK